MHYNLRKLNIALLLILFSAIVSCTSSEESYDEEAAIDSSSTEVSAEEDFSDEYAAETSPDTADGAVATEDEFAEFETETKSSAAAPENSEELSLDDELNNTTIGETPAPAETPQSTLPEETIETPPPAIAVEEPPAESPAPIEDSFASTSLPDESTETASVSEIKNIEYRANESGGTIVVEGTGPLTFTSRQNSENNQFVIEIPQSRLPEKLKRPFNTKDFNGDVGSIDAYQNKNSNVTRIVVQLRPGASQPTVSQEGNSLLVMTQKSSSTMAAEDGRSSSDGGSSSLDEASPKTENQLAAEKILTSYTLERYLSNNQQFYGSPISIEMDDLELKQALRFIAEESGINMVIDSGVGGSVSLKLRQVPWDQALVVILKSRQLGYVRQGTILRIATQESLAKEERTVLDSTVTRRTLAPLVVRMIPVSYAKVDEMEKQVRGFLTERRGQVVADGRTGSLVITDTDENIRRIEQIIKSLDIAPSQVLIEGKVIEAAENFSREFGVQWGISGAPVEVGNVNGRAINMRPQLGVSAPAANSSLTAGLTLGTLDLFGDLTAALSLSETENKVKILSSPRIVALHNQQAAIEQKTQLPIETSMVNAGVITRGITYKDVTLSLTVTPQITSDNSVIMNLNVTREFADARDAANNFAVNTRNARTTVIVRNGQTAVIGGIYQDDQTNSETGVPWLRKIPVLGSLFARSTKTLFKSELLIFLTPRVLTDLKPTATSITGEAPVEAPQAEAPIPPTETTL